jgi:hypothetical protein
MKTLLLTTRNQRQTAFCLLILAVQFVNFRSTTLLPEWGSNEQPTKTALPPREHAPQDANILILEARNKTGSWIANMWLPPAGHGIGTRLDATRDCSLGPSIVSIGWHLCPNPTGLRSINSTGRSVITGLSNPGLRIMFCIA